MSDVEPIPEILGKGDFEVRRSKDVHSGYVDLTKKQMVVPLGKTPEEEFIRSHELMHVAITPTDGNLLVGEDVEMRMLQAVEDYRVNTTLDMLGIDTAGELIPPSALAEFVTQATLSRDEMGIAQMYFLLGKTRGETMLRSMAGDLPAYQKAEQIRDKFFKPYEDRNEQIPFQAVIDACNYIAGNFDSQVGESQSDPNGEPQDGDPGDESGSSMSEGEGGEGKSAQDEDWEGQKNTPVERGEKGDFDPENNKTEDKEPETKEAKDFNPNTKKVKASELFEKPEAEKLPEMTKEEIEEGKEYLGYEGMFDFKNRAEAEENQRRDPEAYSDGYGEYNPWEDCDDPGDLVVVFPPLNKKFIPKKSLAKVSSDVGVIPKNLWRYPVDQKIFQEKIRKHKDVAVLIDCSGSMGFREEDVLHILEICPYSMVAVYCGYWNLETGERIPTVGTLAVVANRTHMYDGLITRELVPSSSNMVDVPAIEWLSKRKEKKKLWVSDGGVTGKHDNTLKPQYVRKIVTLMKRHKIVRAHSIRDIPAKLKEMGL